MLTTEQTSTASTSESIRTQLPRIALVGVHGFGSHHLDNLERLEAAGSLKLVAVADPVPPSPGRLPKDTPVFSSLDELIAADIHPDVVIVATPIQTHATLGIAVLAAGADLYLEKPTASSFAEFELLREAASTAGRSVQIGFQSLGSFALPALAQVIESGTIGTVLHVSATGLWLRDKEYYQRSKWAGKRTLNGVDVVDGVTTNPLAHAVATALHIAGIQSADDVASVTTDLYRAHNIEGDDTSCVRITPHNGPTVVSALTVCAPEQKAPFVTVHGSAGKAVFHYTQDVLEITDHDGITTTTGYERADLMENLLSHRRSGTPLLSSLESSGAFMRVLEAVRIAEDPTPISEEYITWVGQGLSAHPVVDEIGYWIERATNSHSTFSELDAPWVRTAESPKTAATDQHINEWTDSL